MFFLYCVHFSNVKQLTWAQRRFILKCREYRHSLPIFGESHHTKCPGRSRERREDLGEAAKGRRHSQTWPGREVSVPQERGIRTRLRSSALKRRCPAIRCAWEAKPRHRGFQPHQTFLSPKGGPETAEPQT